MGSASTTALLDAAARANAPSPDYANTPLGLCVANVVSHNVQAGEFDAPSFTHSHIDHL